MFDILKKNYFTTMEHFDKVTLEMIFLLFIFCLIAVSRIDCLRNITPAQQRDPLQRIALVRASTSDGYHAFKIANPYVEGNKMKFKSFGSRGTDGYIYYHCPSEEDPSILKIVEETEDKEYSYERCSSEPTLVINKLTNDNNVRKLYHIGYGLPVHFTTMKYKIVPIVKFVMDHSKLTPISVKYKMPSARLLEIESNLKMTYDKSSPVYGIGKDIDQLYQINQQENCRRIFQNDYLCNHSAMREGLIKKQLAPKDDFLFPSWKKASFSDALTVPMWTVFSYKWILVEHFVRRLANVVEMLEVFAGAGGIMNLKKGDQDIDMYLGPTAEDLDFKIAIPAYIWKFFSFGNIEMIIILHNNPFEDNIPKICEEDVCRTNGVPIYNDNFRDGLIYCCPSTIPNMSKLMEIDFSDLNSGREDPSSKLPENVLEEILTFE